MLMWIVAVIVVAVLAVLGIAAARPNSFRITRQATIRAPAEKVFALINDFHEWTKWSPWKKMDPALNRNYSGAAAGKGAIYGWNGNKKVGEGRMEIVDTQPPSRIDIKLDLVKPFEAHNSTVVTFTPRDGGTLVEWAMSGQSPFMFKLMGLFTNMDQMIGKDFEAGLANMKKDVEA